MAQPPPLHNQMSMSGGVSRNIFVGRQREIAELRAALDEALSGHGRIVMLVGEPGIGKTRTAQELAFHAESQGAQVLSGWCYEEQGAPPYWPWVQPIRTYVAQTNSEQLRAEMGPGAADIAEIVPEVRIKLPGLETPPALEPEQARFRLFDSVTSFLKNAAQSHPLVIVLDDLHWADRSSLLLLEFLAQDIAGCRLLLIGTYRDVEVSRQHPLFQTLGSLVRQSAGGGFQSMELAGLSREEVGRFVEVTSGVTPSLGLVEAVHTRTQGNPLFVGEVVHLLGREGLEEERAWNARIPDGIRATIGRRLNHLSGQCNETLTIASVIGRQFTLDQLKPLVEDMTEDRLLEVLEEALAVRVIEELPRAMGRYQFTHALIQEALIEELSATRRVRLHARIAETLEELYGDDAEAHAAELAHHFAEAEDITGQDKMVHYDRLAGQRALAIYAWEEAQSHFERALVAKGVSLTGTEQAADDESAGLLCSLGLAQMAILPSSQHNAAVTTLGRAFDYYFETQDAAAAVAIAGLPFRSTVAVESIKNALFIPRALGMVQGDSHEAGQLHSRYGYELGRARSDYAGAQDSFRSALEIARDQGDVALESRTLTDAAQVDFAHLNYQDSLENSLRVIELDTAGGELQVETSHWYAVRALIALGDIKSAWPHAKAQLALAEKRRERSNLAQALEANEVLAYLEGDWETARISSERALAIDPRDTRLLHFRTILEYQLGEFSSGDIYLERMLESIRQLPPYSTIDHAIVPMAIGIVTRISGTPNRMDVAMEAAKLTMSSASRDVPFQAQLARTGLALLAIQNGDVSAAEEHYRALITWPITMTPLNLICGPNVLGLLAQTMGNLDQAAEHFEDAQAFCRKGGYRPELAWACCDYADCLLQGNNPGDRDKAISLLDESLAISTELGMRPLMERGGTLRQRAESQPSKPAPYPDGLTEREVEVLRLVAAGKSNPEIGEMLFISPRTVTTHVSHILNKVNAANRAEAATYASRQGLV